MGFPSKVLLTARSPQTESLMDVPEESRRVMVLLGASPFLVLILTTSPLSVTVAMTSIGGFHDFELIFGEKKLQKSKEKGRRRKEGRRRWKESKEEEDRRN